MESFIHDKCNIMEKNLNVGSFPENIKHMHENREDNNFWKIGKTVIYGKNIVLSFEKCNILENGLIN